MVKETPEEVLKDSNKESALPVLRLLRPEFRAQLTLAKRKPSSPVCSVNRPLDTVDGAVGRIIPVAVEVDNETNYSKIIEERETVNTPLVKDGHFYLKMVLDETARLEILAAELEAEVNSVPEYMEGRLRAATGKARLLASQKLAQFKGLCHKNINGWPKVRLYKFNKDILFYPLPHHKLTTFHVLHEIIENSHPNNQDTSEDFPTTCEDLAGFWDMVSIQVNSVHEEFNQIDGLRKAGWPQQDSVEGEGVKVSNGNGGSRRTKSLPAQSKTMPAKSNINKARDEARKRMLAERRKEMRKNTNSNEDIVIV